MAKLGTLIFQANDTTDVFYKVDVFENGLIESLDPLANFEGIDWDNSPWITGDIPKPQPVTVDGDVSVIYALFKGLPIPQPFNLIIYVYYEEVEELLSAEEDHSEEEILK